MSEKQLVVFKVGDVKYGVDVTAVGAITDYEEITSIPDSPDYLEGIMNLRGDIIPVINLKKRFNVSQIEEDKKIIVSNVKGTEMGFIVDGTSQVLKLDDENIDPLPILLRSNDEYIKGIGKYDNELIILIDFNEIISSEEQKLITNKVNK